MNIGMILDDPFPPDPRVENEAVELIKRGFKVFLFCVTYNKGQAQTEDYRGIQVKRFMYPAIVRKWKALVYTVPVYQNILSKNIADFISRNKIDVLHIHDMLAAGAVHKANKAFGLPFVLDLHENRPEIMKYYTYVNSLPGRLLISPAKFKRKEEFFIRRSSKVVVVTEEAKQEIRARLGIEDDKINVFTNFVRKRFYTDYTVKKEISSRYKNHFTIVYLGETGARRGLETAVTAIPRLVRTIPDLKLVIVGKSLNDKKLQSLAEKLGVSRFIDFEGWKPFELFQSYILAADVCISPLLRNIHHDTTIANKISQYLSLGKPVLVSNCPPQARLVAEGRCGLVYKAADTDDFEEKIIRLYQDRKARTEMGQNGSRYVKQMNSRENLAGELIRMYTEIQREIER